MLTRGGSQSAAGVKRMTERRRQDLVVVPGLYDAGGTKSQSSVWHVVKPLDHAPILPP